MKKTTKNKVLIGLAATLGLLAVVVVIAIVSLDPKSLIQTKKDALLQDVSTKIGRELVSGDVTTRVGASLGATIQGIRLAGPKREDGQPSAPQLQIQQVDVELSLLRALFSFGRDLHVERFTVDGLVVRAARDEDGVWDFQDILDKLDEGKDPNAPEEQSDLSFLEGLRIAHVYVRNGRVELNDAVLGRPLAVGELNVDVSDVVLGDPLAVSIKANLEDAGKKSPVDVDVKLAQLPKDLKFDPLPDLEIKAKLQDVDLGPWGGLAPADSPAPVAGTLRTDLTIKLTKDTDVVDVNGVVMTRGLVLRDAIGAVADKAARLAAPRGTPLDLDVDLALHVDPEVTKLDKLKATGSGVDVAGTLTIKGAGLAGLEQADVKASVADLAKLLGALPPSLRGLPPEVTIDGPLTAALTKTGEAITGNVVLDGAHVRYLSKDEKTGVDEAVFDKAAGKALNIKLVGKTDGKVLTVDDFALLIDTFKLAGKMVIPVDDNAALTADVHSGAVGLGSLQGLIPPFRAAIGKGQKVEGTLSIDVNARSAAGKQEAVVDVGLKGLDVNLASLIVKGNGGLDIKANPTGSEVTIVAKADFDGLSIRQVSDDGETSLNKPAGLPLRFDVDVKKGETDAVINSARLVIGKSAINGKGTIKNMGQKGENMALDFGAVDVAFDDLRQALPGASKLPAGGRLKGALALKGGLSAEALGLDAKNVDVTFGSSAIKGTVSVDNFTDPVLDIDLTTLNLGFDDLRPVSNATADLPKGGRFEGSLKMNGNTAKMASVTVDAKINRLIAGKSDLKGAIRITDLDKPKFVLGTQSDFLDVDGLQEALGGGGDEPEAKGPKQPRENKHGLSKETRELLAGVSGKATLQAKKALMKDMTMTNFTGVLVMTRGVAKFEKLDFGFYGGTVTASGTTLDLPAERTKYDLRFDAKNVDFGAFLADQTKIGKLFKGTVSPSLAIKGRGIAPGDFALTADGPAEMKFRELTIGSIDLLGPINDALAATGKTSKATAKAEKGLQLINFTALTRLVGGQMKLEKPIDADTPFGKMKIEGSSGLDSDLNFKALLNLTPATIKKMTGGKVTVKDAIPVPLKIGGTWENPKITGIEIDKLLKAIVGDKVNDAIDKGRDVVEDKVKDKVKDTVGEKGKDAVEDALGGLLGDKKKKKKK